jgi:ATP-binding dynein motor region
MVTNEGLDEQLLSIVCFYESSKDEVEREKLARQNLEYTKQRRLYMDQILEMLRTSGEEILESDDFVNAMEESRKITSDITNKLSATRHIEERIEENRKMLRPVAQLASRLFFAVKSLSSIEPMY